MSIFTDTQPEPESLIDWVEMDRKAEEGRIPANVDDYTPQFVIDNAEIERRRQRGTLFLAE